MYWNSRIHHHVWNPLADLEDVQAQISQLVAGGAPGAAALPIEVWQKEDVLRVRALVPGVSKDDLDISVEGTSLTLKSSARVDAEPSEQRWQRRERVLSRVSRVIRLPFEADAERVQATLVNGVLEIEIPRAERDKPRRVVINAT